jgi:hypothetical protein
VPDARPLAVARPPLHHRPRSVRLRGSAGERRTFQGGLEFSVGTSAPALCHGGKAIDWRVYRQAGMRSGAGNGETVAYIGGNGWARVRDVEDANATDRPSDCAQAQWNRNRDIARGIARLKVVVVFCPGRPPEMAERPFTNRSLACSQGMASTEVLFPGIFLSFWCGNPISCRSEHAIRPAEGWDSRNQGISLQK